jgi:hypothetical protein
MNPNGNTGGYFLLISGLCVLVFFLVFMIRTWYFVRRSVGANGEVVGLECSRDEVGSATYQSYAPVFTFTVADGRTYRVISNISSSPAAFSVGDSVRVLYDPASPEDARIQKFSELWGAALIGCLVGLGFFFYGCKMIGILHLGA